ncbi:hypothetical protein [Actinomadura violacea]|uniref:Uncharacterized protein n=1 Tax=Actinomadura violacea TaxID=2819934 RepID=A0ABS3RXW6_9ACTN|nr:hypothetical protein [Actinomadura violacea]MBO2461138.1 hypothetical protein [Actinomadura violacea]
MAWLRYSDTFTQQREWDSVSYEARWHYKAMVERCSLGRRWNGRLTIEQARRASDVPDPDRCIAELEKAGFVSVARNNPRNGGPVDNSAAAASVTRNSDVTSTVTCDAVTVTVTMIDDHIPPPSIRDNAPNSKLRMQRKRAHDKGEHHLCLPKRCPDAPPENGPPVTRGVTRNPGTGLDRSSSSRVESNEDTNSSDDEISPSGLVGGAGGGTQSGVTRNTSPVEPVSTGTARKVSRAAQEKDAARWLRNRYPGTTDGVIARTFAVASERAAAAGQPVRNLRRYLESWAEGDLADVLNAAMDLEDAVHGTAAEEGEAETHSGLRLVPGRDRRAAIDACPRCDHNGMNNEDEDRPRRCDHRPPGHASQLPILNSVHERDGEEEGLPAADDRRQARTAMDRVNQARTSRRRHG